MIDNGLGTHSVYLCIFYFRARKPLILLERGSPYAQKLSNSGFNHETYSVPAARVGEQVLLKLGWDKVEVLDHSGQHLATLPRSYTVKTQPIDWKGYFGIFVRKPRGARHAAMYRFLPSAVRDFLERGEAAGYRTRLKFIFALLEEGFSIDDIARAIQASSSQDPALIRHQLYQLRVPAASAELLKENYTPPSVRDYNPAASVYERLVPQREGAKGIALSSLERAL